MICLKNHNIAVARLSVVILLTPLLGSGIVFALLAIQGPAAYGMAGFMIGLLIALWTTLKNVIWTIAVDECLEIRRTFGRIRRPIHDVVRVRIRAISSQFSRSALIQHSLLVFEMDRGPAFEVMMPSDPLRCDLYRFLESHQIPIVR